MAFLTRYDKGKSTVYPSQTVFHNVCSGHTVLFLCLCDLVSKERHKATTRNGVPQGVGRPQHIPTQNDTVVMFVRGHRTFIAIV